MLIDKKAPWYDKIEIAMIIVIFSILTVILFVNVVTRFCFHYTATWSEQAARYLFVWMTFAGVSLAGKTSSHLQVTVANMVFGEERAAREDCVPHRRRHRRPLRMPSHL